MARQIQQIHHNTQKSQPLPDHTENPQPQLFFGHELPQNLTEKAATFLLGMATTYILQLSSPAIMYYTSVTARLLRVALIWIAVSVVVCWYAGILSPKVADWQDSFSSIMVRFSPDKNGPEKGISEFPGPERIRPSSRVPRSHRPRSPVREMGPRNSPPDLQVRNAVETDPEQVSPTINVRPFIAPIREGLRKTQSEFQVQKSIQPLKLALGERPNSDRMTSENDIPRRFSNPKPFRRPLSVHPDNATIVSSYSRRNSAGSFGENSSKLNKPLPPVMDDSIRESVSDSHLPHMEVYSEGDRAGFLARGNSVMSKKSVLGTRANYSKFLANVNQ